MLFFVGLVAFIVLVAFALGRLRLPSGNKTQTVATVTSVTAPSPTARPTPTKASGTGIFGWLFKRSTPSPISPSAQPSPKLGISPTTLAQPTYIVKNPTIPVRQNSVNGVTTIPETGSPTILLALPGILSAAGFWMRKRS
ncbi:hypothetical protein COU89_00505 [Candidatus Roizmanbacteria bacterium CG10_big_fil_rev_8_21_14_0_10_45_7]|uniref:Uncharacterized protein n=1 Tax=Candidatus Roizmanbacteria bacterium CG10_big_fil_rev_8_21_14_0_10_45_7 TaxID=1974854 RepID=A0A2M8KVI8_9BACT|nr:MAG: hypothetical protein COU89_00505 [Candidatus Roizmanbacteria bacterium CG10_big_fil_rev_8_21_14_0_10_45_7]